MPTKVILFLCLKLMFHDVEDDGTHNYLVGGGQPEYLVAFNSDKDVHWKDGCYEVEVECYMETMALDPAPPALEEAFPWGVSRVGPICNALSIEGGGLKWRERSR